MDLTFNTEVYIYTVYILIPIYLYTHMYNVQYLGTRDHFHGMMEAQYS